MFESLLQVHEVISFLNTVCDLKNYYLGLFIQEQIIRYGLHWTNLIQSVKC